MLKRFSNWLSNAPITDPVDRRNAPVMQLLLLCYGLLLPLNWAWRIVARGALPTEGRMIILLMDAVIVVLAWVSIALIRRGRFRPAIMLFLAPQLISLEIVFYQFGTQPQLIDPAPTILPLVIAGLVLGRGALWAVFGLLMMVFATGFATEIRHEIEAGAPFRRALLNVPAVVISHLLITAVLDRTIKALRESLDESIARGHELQHEMAERERTQSQLIHAQKLEASGRLASGVAHDFSNILDVILGFSKQRHVLRDEGSDAEQAAALSDSLQGVEVAANNGVALTRKLLSFSRNDVLKIEVFDAGRALTELRPMLRQLFPPSVRLDLHSEPGPLPVRLDRSEFELMILNIAANARDAMRDGGRFEAKVSRPSPDSIEIMLADSGHGMDEHVRQRIFEPFFSTKDAVDGTGLGLAVIHDLVKVTGGEIRVDSVVGQGSVFAILLPAAIDLEQAADA